MVIDGWYCCPHCRMRLVKVDPTAKASGIKIKCKRCRQEVEIRIEKN